MHGNEFLWSTEDFMIQSEWIQPVNQNIGLDDMNENDIEELFMNHPVYIASNLIFQQKNIVPPRPLNLSDLDGIQPEFVIPDGNYNAFNKQREEIGLISSNGNIITYHGEADLYFTKGIFFDGNFLFD
jgi:hypothetical protein